MQALPMGLLCVLMTALPGRLGAAVEYAPIMPMAKHSLLIDICPAGDRIVTVGERGHVLYSDNNGASWLQSRVPTTRMLTGVYFVDPQRGWTVGHDGLVLVSDDGGVNWRVQRDGIAAQSQANIRLREQAHQQLRSLKLALEQAEERDRPALEMQLEEAVLDLEDADLALEEPVFTSPLMDVWFQNRERGWAIGAFGTLLMTDNGGQDWSDQSGLIANPEEFHLNAITGDGKGLVFIAGEAGGMFRSHDGGLSWESLAPFYEGSWFGAVYSESSHSLLVFGLRGNLFRSSDFGDTWEKVESDNQITLAGGGISDTGEIALVGGVGTVMRSSDGGDTFERSVMPERLSLSSAVFAGDSLILVGQGGVKTYSGNGADE